MQIHLNDEPDKLIWRWSNSGSYSSKSVYKALLGGGRICWSFDELWKCKAPPMVHIFAYLILKGKILTRDVLNRRGLHCDRRCVTCVVCQEETAVHLLFLCRFATQVWRSISALAGGHLLTIGTEVQHVWEESWRVAKRQGKLTRAEWTSTFLCTCWFVWKHRNEVVFGGKLLQPEIIARRAYQESKLWLKCC